MTKDFKYWVFDIIGSPTPIFCYQMIRVDLSNFNFHDIIHVNLVHVNKVSKLEFLHSNRNLTYLKLMPYIESILVTQISCIDPCSRVFYLCSNCGKLVIHYTVKRLKGLLHQASLWLGFNP